MEVAAGVDGTLVAPVRVAHTICVLAGPGSAVRRGPAGQHGLRAAGVSRSGNHAETRSNR